MTTTTTFEPTFDLEAVPAHHRAQVEAMIPEPRFEDIYTHRHITSTVNGAKYLDFDVFDAAFGQKHNVMLPGPTGSGKTTALRAYAAHHRLPYVSVEFQGGFDFSTVIGSVQVNEEGIPRFVDGEVTLVLRYAGVCVLEECNFAPPRFTAAFHGALDARQTLYLPQTGERVRKSPDTLIAATYNPGYAGVSTLNEAFRNRFAYTLQWGYDAEVEDVRIGTNSTTLLEMVRNMRSLKEMEGIDIGTNLMEEFVMMSKATGIGLASHSFLNHFEDDVQASVSEALSANLWNIATELKVDADG